MLDMEALARELYAAFSDPAVMVQWAGTWEELAPDSQECWRAVARRAFTLLSSTSERP